MAGAWRSPDGDHALRRAPAERHDDAAPPRRLPDHDPQRFPDASATARASTRSTISVGRRGAPDPRSSTARGSSNYLRAGAEPGAGARARRTVRRSRSASAVGVLAAGGRRGRVRVDEWFVDALHPTLRTLGISETFAGLVIVAIAGNAVENVVAIQLALEAAVRPRDLRGQELGRADRGVPLPGPRPHLAALHAAGSRSRLPNVGLVLVVALVFAALAIWQITGRRRGGRLRGLRARRALRRARDRRLVRVSRIAECELRGSANR